MRTRGWVALAALVVVVAGCSNSEQAKKEFFENGERFLKENKYQEAIVEFRNALQQDEKYGEARLKLAEAYTATGNAAAAFREYVRAADLLPQNNDAQIKAATFLMLAGQFEDARTRILPVVDRDPDQRRGAAHPRQRPCRAEGSRRRGAGDRRGDRARSRSRSDL